MSVLRFKVGELAIIAGDVRAEFVGKIAEVTFVGPWGLFSDTPAGFTFLPVDYIIRISGKSFGASDSNLRKLYDPGCDLSIETAVDEEVSA